MIDTTILAACIVTTSQEADATGRYWNATDTWRRYDRIMNEVERRNREQSEL